MKLLILVALALIFAPSAYGAVGVGIPLGEVHYVNDPLVAEALDVADAEWGRGTCAVRLGTHPLVPTAGAIGPLSGPEYAADCYILFNPGWLTELHNRIASADYGTRRQAYRDLCHAMVHEKGHLLGYLDEDPAPLQGVMTSAVWDLWLPACTVWVNAKVGVAVAPVQTLGGKAPAKGKPGVTIQVRPCTTRACGRRYADQARRVWRHRRAVICQKADLALTAGKQPPIFCTK